MSKTFEDFKQQVAEKYGYKDWNELYKHTVGAEYADYSLELIELYAQYQREEGRKEVARYIYDNYETDGLENMNTRDYCNYDYCKSILKGLKDEK